VPATSLTNWPDEFIHSTGDDLEQLDATQLERNALIVSAVAWYFANWETKTRPCWGPTSRRAASRVSPRTSRPRWPTSRRRRRRPPAAFRAARALVRSAYDREKAALASVRRLAPQAGRRPLSVPGHGRLDEGLGADLRALERAWTAVTGRSLPDLEPTRDEEAMDAVVYVPWPTSAPGTTPWTRSGPFPGCTA
jgi:hypothetical protein